MLLLFFFYFIFFALDLFVLFSKYTQNTSLLYALFHLIHGNFFFFYLTSFAYMYEWEKNITSHGLRYYSCSYSKSTHCNVHIRKHLPLHIGAVFGFHFVSFIYGVFHCKKKTEILLFTDNIHSLQNTYVLCVAVVLYPMHFIAHAKRTLYFRCCQFSTIVC